MSLFKVPRNIEYFFNNLTTFLLNISVFYLRSNIEINNAIGIKAYSLRDAIAVVETDPDKDPDYCDMGIGANKSYISESDNRCHISNRKSLFGAIMLLPPFIVK